VPLVDRQDIRNAIGEVTGWQIRGSTTSNGAADGTTIIAAASGLDEGLYSSARDQRVGVEDVVIITESGHARRGERRYATGAPDTAGTVTVSPAFGGQIVSGVDYEIWKAEGPHPDDLDRCIDRALTERCWFWRAVPITLLRGGDIGDELVVSADDLHEFSSTGTKIWTGGGDITLTLEELDTPDEFTRRVIRLVGGGAGADAHIESNVIEVDPTNRPNWHIRALVRSMGTVAGAAAGTGNGSEIKIMDKTNSAEISPDQALSSTNRAWTVIESNFTIPTTCHQIAVRLNVETAGEDGEFAWVQLMELQATDFPLSNRIDSKRKIGPVFERVGDEYRGFRRRQWSGSLERREAQGRGVSLHLEPAPGSRSLWFYEKVSFPVLTSSTPAATDDDNETWAAEEWIRESALLEAYEFLRRRDQHTHETRWLEEIQKQETKVLALQAEYGIEPMLTEDSPRPHGRIFAKV